MSIGIPLQSVKMALSESKYHRYSTVHAYYSHFLLPTSSAQVSYIEPTIHIIHILDYTYQTHIYAVPSYWLMDRLESVIYRCQVMWYSMLKPPPTVCTTSWRVFLSCQLSPRLWTKNKKKYSSVYTIQWWFAEVTPLGRLVILQREGKDRKVVSAGNGGPDAASELFLL